MYSRSRESDFDSNVAYIVNQQPVLVDQSNTRQGR